MGEPPGVGAADTAAVDLDVAVGLETAHCLPYGGALGVVARLLDAVDDARAR